MSDPAHAGQQIELETHLTLRQSTMPPAESRNNVVNG
jgi:hypothetical protein